MKISKNSKVGQSEIEIIDGIYYKVIKKNIVDIHKACDMDAKYCESCPFEKECGNNEEYHVWRKVK